MHSVARVLITSWLFCLSLSISASDLKEESLDELLVLSGLQSQARDVVGSINAIVGQRGGEKAKEFVKLFEQIISPDKLLDDIKGNLQSNLSQAEVEELIAWYSSNLGNRIARAEEAAAQPGSMAAIQQQAAALSADQERMSLSNSIVQASGFIEKSIDSQLFMTLIGEIVALQAQNAGEDVDIEKIKGFIEQQQEAMKAQLENFLQIMIAYTYRDFSSEEINDYVKMLKRPAMKKFNQLGQDASNRSLEDMIKSFASENK